MDRFTEKFKDGRNILRREIVDIFHVGFGRLFAGKAIDKLSNYEDKLLILPCAVDDEVYCVYGKEMFPAIVEEIEVSRYGFSFILKYAGCEDRLKHWSFRTAKDVIGKTVFLTKEQAETKLKEMEGKE